jgi:hypothetical protein
LLMNRRNSAVLRPEINNEAQLVLPFSLSEEALKDRLQKAAGKKVSLTLTDNSTSMISARAKDGVLHVRLHRMFLQSDAVLLDEIAAFMRGKKSKTPLIMNFIKRNSCFVKKGKQRKYSLKQLGTYHDLRILAASVNEEYFGGRITAPVTWGTGRLGRAVRRRTLGSYSGHTNTIRINPILDKKRVPSYFIEFIIYHEMLHADMGIESGKERRSVHPREFRRRERLFEKYAEALDWEKSTNFLF